MSIIAIIACFRGAASAYPLSFIVPSLSFADEIWLYCLPDDVAWARSHCSQPKHHVICFDHVRLSIHELLTAALVDAAHKLLPDDIIVACHADIFLTEDWRTRFALWLHEPNQLYYSPVARVCLYSWNPLTDETQWGGTIAFRNDRSHYYILDGSFLEEHPPFPYTAPLPGFDPDKHYQVELGQVTLRQIALKDVRNETLLGRIPNAEFYDWSREYLGGRLAVADYLAKYVSWVRQYSQWAGGSLANCNAFCASELGKRFIAAYGSTEESKLVRDRIWSCL